ncbi:unnamed protein product [Notodromas monacha]|uniref:Uncharacterized protein n=1 Tax=Notodromas monacha TaxID=399045 RepID=A0A7R9BN94_9CRUS|nr:unnamed protein product [Notodromas monacha]CAG0918318.1 unnamed protein product [Notodromas monacha]
MILYALAEQVVKETTFPPARRRAACQHPCAFQQLRVAEVNDFHSKIIHLCLMRVVDLCPHDFCTFFKEKELCCIDQSTMNTESTMPEDTTCDECGKYFNTKELLYDHMDLEHRVICPICGTRARDLTVACDNCEILHHMECVGIHPMEAPAESDEWFCPKCRPSNVGRPEVKPPGGKSPVKRKGKGSSQASSPGDFDKLLAACENATEDMLNAQATAEESRDTLSEEHFNSLIEMDVEKKYHCKLCPPSSVLPTRKAAEMHLTNLHMSSQLFIASRWVCLPCFMDCGPPLHYRCPLCEKTGKSKEELLMHAEIHQEYCDAARELKVASPSKLKSPKKSPVTKNVDKKKKYPVMAGLNVQFYASKTSIIVDRLAEADPSALENFFNGIVKFSGGKSVCKLCPVPDDLNVAGSLPFLKSETALEHFLKAHFRFRIAMGDTGNCLRCLRLCKRVTDDQGSGHYHCPLCQKLLPSHDTFVSHAAEHMRTKMSMEKPNETFPLTWNVSPMDSMMEKAPVAKQPVHKSVESRLTMAAPTGGIAYIDSMGNKLVHPLKDVLLKCKLCGFPPADKDSVLQHLSSSHLGDCIRLDEQHFLPCNLFCVPGLFVTPAHFHCPLCPRLITCGDHEATRIASNCFLKHLNDVHGTCGSRVAANQNKFQIKNDLNVGPEKFLCVAVSTQNGTDIGFEELSVVLLPHGAFDDTRALHEFINLPMDFANEFEASAKDAFLLGAVCRFLDSHNQCVLCGRHNVKRADFVDHWKEVHLNNAVDVKVSGKTWLCPCCLCGTADIPHFVCPICSAVVETREIFACHMEKHEKAQDNAGLTNGEDQTSSDYDKAAVEHESSKQYANILASCRGLKVVDTSALEECSSVSCPLNNEHFHCPLCKCEDAYLADFGGIGVHIYACPGASLAYESNCRKLLQTVDDEIRCQLCSERDMTCWSLNEEHVALTHVSEMHLKKGVTFSNEVFPLCKLLCRSGADHYHCHKCGYICIRSMEILDHVADCLRSLKRPLDSETSGDEQESKKTKFGDLDETSKIIPDVKCDPADKTLTDMVKSESKDSEVGEIEDTKFEIPEDLKTDEVSLKPEAIDEDEEKTEEPMELDDGPRSEPMSVEVERECMDVSEKDDKESDKVMDSPDPQEEAMGSPETSETIPTVITPEDQCVAEEREAKDSNESNDVTVTEVTTNDVSATPSRSIFDEPEEETEPVIATPQKPFVANAANVSSGEETFYTPASIRSAPQVEFFTAKTELSATSTEQLSPVKLNFDGDNSDKTE